MIARAKTSRSKKIAAIRAGGEEAARIEALRRFEARLSYVYGITLATYDAMATAQDGRCAICRLSPVGRGKTNALVVDHCHASGDNRELLCGNCNIAIGLMSDDPEIAIRAAGYLRKHASALSPAPR